MKKLWTMYAAVALSGCVTTGEISRWMTPEKQIEVSDVRRSQQCGTPDAAAHVRFLPDLVALRAWELARGATLSAGEPALARGPFAVVEVGRRGTAGYGVAVSRHASRHGEVLTLKGTSIAPPAGREPAQLDTAPCVLVSLPPRDYQAIEIVDQTGALRATSVDETP
jgi:hypothetical protein